ncbi:MAG: isoprenylcysteine carboxylmethyltransferase family protein, partial [Candidatus Omnitrophica bacterium]|nr:isoprenylcysteine carboxylmethyltransferase family protein [Candidatus Omnitrophota bacterium]
MNLKNRLKRCFKPRFAVIYPFGVYALFCSSDEHSLKNGIGYIIAGALLRLWSNGYAIKNDRLSTCGPYAFVRNPLYLGTFLIALGLAIVLKMGWVMTVLFLAVLGWVYSKTIREEEEMLEAKFGDEYKKYCSKTPALVPSLIPYIQGEKWPFRIRRLIDSKEHKPVFWIIILLILFHLKTRLLLEHKPMTTTTWAWVALGLILIGLDILYEFNKKKIH